jgi:hypothetical protein
MAEVQKPADQPEEKNLQKTPEAAAVSGVVATKSNQQVFSDANAFAHANDKTLSEPDLIAMEEGETLAAYKARVERIQANRFGFFDSENDGKQVFEKPAKQAVEPMPALSPMVNDGPYNSQVKLNVQITNVPEVSDGIKPEEALQYTDTMLKTGAQAVEHFVHHMEQANAVNDDIAKLKAHFCQSPYQLNKDIEAILSSIDQPMNADERAEAAGNLLPLFFFEGAKEPINPETVEQMSLETMTEEELAELGIEKRILAADASEESIAGEVKSGEIANPEAFEMGVQPKPGTLSNIEARDWYNGQVDQINAVEQAMRQTGKTPEEIFQVTTELRNQAKQLARDFMSDRRAAARLDKESPILPPEEYLAKYGGDYEKAIEASKRTNAEVNKRIEKLRKEREQDS